MTIETTTAKANGKKAAVGTMPGSIGHLAQRVKNEAERHQNLYLRRHKVPTHTAERLVRLYLASEAQSCGIEFGHFLGIFLESRLSSQDLKALDQVPAEAVQAAVEKVFSTKA